MTRQASLAVPPVGLLDEQEGEDENNDGGRDRLGVERAKVERGEGRQGGQGRSC